MTSYQYDLVNRRSTRTFLMSQQEVYTYDHVGNLGTHTDSTGLLTTCRAGGPA